MTDSNLGTPTPPMSTAELLNIHKQSQAVEELYQQSLLSFPELGEKYTYTNLEYMEAASELAEFVPYLLDEIARLRATITET
jgi:hypothetical protein